MATSHNSCPKMAVSYVVTSESLDLQERAPFTHRARQQITSIAENLDKQIKPCQEPDLTMLLRLHLIFDYRTHTASEDAQRHIARIGIIKRNNRPPQHRPSLVVPQHFRPLPSQSPQQQGPHVTQHSHLPWPRQSSPSTATCCVSIVIITATTPPFIASLQEYSRPRWQDWSSCLPHREFDFADWRLLDAYCHSRSFRGAKLDAPDSRSGSHNHPRDTRQSHSLRLKPPVQISRT